MNPLHRRNALRFAVRALGCGLAASLSGCGGERTLVAEGDPLERRKKKDEALEKMLNPNGVQPGKGKGKGKSRAGGKASAVDEMYLP